MQYITLYLLEKDDYITDHASNTISSCSKKMGTETEKIIINMIQDLFHQKRGTANVEECQHLDVYRAKGRWYKKLSGRR
jgi:hypothetical protein